MTYLTLYELLGPFKERTFTNSYTTSTIDTLQTSHASINLLQFTIPEGKLFYPEPFIASASYLHSDLTYLHLFQYWYWLWFLFIFLICFFLISFVSTVRWCAIRTRPRRETRGVSRSKCGDLITACVPVSWAISIIVNESADSTDLNDGFGTAELVVGVRAYQWGWEYYYPKSIDLNYNVKSSYGSFIGNSIYYRHTSGYNSTSQTLWRMYQNKDDDVIITPAHVLFAPHNEISLLTLSDIGVNTLQETSAFAKIRNAVKTYTTHLTYIPSPLLSNYFKLQSLYFNETDFIQSSSFKMKPQHMFLSSSASSNATSAINLDEQSFQQFLNYSTKVSTTDITSHRLMGCLSAISASFYSPSTNSQLMTFISKLVYPSDSSLETFSKRLLYPSFELQINNNSEKIKFETPLLKQTSNVLLNIHYSQINTAFASRQTEMTTSFSTPKLITSSLSDTSMSRQFDTNGPNSKVLLEDQSIRITLPSINSISNLNLVSGSNEMLENTNFYSFQNRAFNIFSGTLLRENQYINYTLFNNLLTAQSFNQVSLPAVQSLREWSLNSLEHDTTNTYESFLIYKPVKGLTLHFNRTSGLTNDLFIGSREKTPRALNTTYWSTFWANSCATHRVSTLLSLNTQRAHFYLPTFINYSDYDFRNDQAFDLLEDLIWETSFSSYSFLDYLSLPNSSTKYHLLNNKNFMLEDNFSGSTLGVNKSPEDVIEPILKDTSTQLTIYSNSIQMEDYLSTPSQLTLNDYTAFNLHSELMELDDSFTTFKNFHKWFVQSSNSLFVSSTSELSTRSYISVFNSFRSDLDDFQFYTSDVISFPQTYAQLFTNTLSDININTIENRFQNTNSRLSNLISLRSSVRNSVVNSNAFQKVFKPRLDESRALVNSSSFADLSLRQPFLSDKSIPYFQLLGKNRTSYFTTPLYLSQRHSTLNILQSLIVSTTSSFYDFPFLLAKTSDTMRFTWVDWFSKWAYLEVQPSSISRYSTVGVPYFRKPFDFNSTTGDKFQDVESYFTRVSRSRRNYLPLWMYSPLLFTRSYSWYLNSTIDLGFSCLGAQLSGIKHVCSLMHWYWNASVLRRTTTDVFIYSNSGNQTYSKSTYQPRSSVQSYYNTTSSLVDILSHREYLYRLLLVNRFRLSSLPKNLTSSSTNSLLLELKSSFLFSDPATFSSESTRELLYSVSPLIKLKYWNELLNWVVSLDLSQNINLLNYSSLVYLFHYFLNYKPLTIGQNSELLKTQFRPLKKGISSMLRLHSTGAVAMPIEIRLQVLASSRDVIHSWSIPSASVKIDCVPGYTSHKTLKFFLTGVYWGQCQEICGRYHHWMPIVVYFMKRDLFFLWCTHFVFTRNASNTWDIGDRRFANLTRIASYDQSLWLSEFNTIH